MNGEDEVGVFRAKLYVKSFTHFQKHRKANPFVFKCLKNYTEDSMNLPDGGNAGTKSKI